MNVTAKKTNVSQRNSDLSTDELRDAVVAAAIKAGIQLAPELIKFIAEGVIAGIHAIEESIGTPPYSVGGMVAEIILGVDRTWPQASGDYKARTVRDAIRQYIMNHNGGLEPSDRAINLLLEAGLQVTLPKVYSTPSEPAGGIG